MKRLRLKNRLAELIAANERKTSRKWTYDDISNATGISTSTLSAYGLNKVTRFDEVTVVALMEFLGITDVGKLLVLEEEAEDEGQENAVAVG